MPGYTFQACHFCPYSKDSLQLQFYVLAEHLVGTCPKCPEVVRKALWSVAKKGTKLWKCGILRGFHKRQAPTDAERTPRPTKQKKISEYTDYCDQNRANQINQAIMEFITGCAMPMLLVESPFFIKMLKSLNEDYVSKRRVYKKLASKIIRVCQGANTKAMEQQEGNLHDLRVLRAYWQRRS
mmetsp:Transcript_21576/g.57618  ORF Transcript_21576/g.57618 Transcript_21576/m.57618 type:complete len:182 (-) Transcript_21576:1523-2068(-)